MDSNANFVKAVSTLDIKGLFDLREEYDSYVRKMQPRIENDKTEYYTHVDAGKKDVDLLAQYKSRLGLIDDVVRVQFEPFV